MTSKGEDSKADPGGELFWVVEGDAEGLVDEQASGTGTTVGDAAVHEDEDGGSDFGVGAGLVGLVCLKISLVDSSLS